MKSSFGAFASLAAASLVLSAQAFAGAGQSASFTSFHTDYRKTPKFEEFALPAQKSQKTLAESQETVARAFLAAHAGNYGLSADAHELSLTKVQSSLLGTHFHFAQMVDGVAVDKGEVIVSVDHATHTVLSAYNNFFPGQEKLSNKAKKALLTSDKAYDAAWSDLKVHGKLQDAPKAKLVYRVDGKGKFRLVYVTFLNTQAPFGAWQHEVDAVTGKVLGRVDTAIERKATHKAKFNPASFTGVVTDRQTAFADFAQKTAARKAAASAVTPPAAANGKGLVFDPDPRTTLNNGDLQDGSPAADFDAAYFTRDLRDIAFDGTTYKLDGPWVKIGDFESPTDAPSTTTDGNWTAKRGVNGFDDAMVYFHLDQSQRYIQSLGFVGAKKIQGGPIEADTDGVNGDDNSHYIPESNKLAYGHGCVDDDEDSDVILHEYGHAITFSINSNFEGGDAGAMGEGFGDYWAASYSYSTPNGQLFRPYDIYSWDGHGPTDACWPGRVLNATDIMYDASRTYDAHESLPGDRQTDELWSTPLFETLTALVEEGVARADVDQIILEGQFGVGAGPTMRELAQSTIVAAQRLHPNGPHARVFTEKFKAQQIIETPQANLAVDHFEYLDLGANGVADPGETIGLKVTVKNSGTLPAGSVHAVLSSQTGGVTVEAGDFDLGAVDAGAVVTSNVASSVVIGNDVACGSSVQLTLTLTYTGGTQSRLTVPVTFTLGTPRGMNSNTAPNTAIPDNDAAGVTSTLGVTAAEQVSANFSVDVNIEHTYIGDLKATLTSPNGVSVILHKNSGGGAANIVGRYPATLTPAEPLSAFAGAPMAGDWKLTIVDSATSDTGKLVSWGLNDVAGYECQQP